MKTQTSSQSQSFTRVPANKHTTQCKKESKSNKATELKPSNKHYQTLAQKHEKISHNNNVFNGKNMSDHTKASNYYQVKAQPQLATRQQTIAQQSMRQQAAVFKDINGQPQAFTRDMLNQFYDDNATIKVSKMPSNLVEVPRVNEKYEISSFFSQPYPQQYLDNLRTLGMMDNKSKDPILNLNPTFYTNSLQSNQTQSQLRSLDPYNDIFNKQKDYHTTTQQNAYIKDFIYRTDFDHPLSFHNQTIDPNFMPQLQVNFPPLVTEKTLKNTTLVQNGFYSKEPLTLNSNSFKEPRNQTFVQTMDERMMPFNDKENYNGGNVFQQQNLLYQANQELLMDIEAKQKEQEYQQYMSQKQQQELLENQRVNEVSPGGTKRIIPLRNPSVQSLFDKHPFSKNNNNTGQYSISPGKESQSSPIPRIEDQYIPESEQKQERLPEKRLVLSIQMREEESPVRSNNNNSIQGYGNDYQSSPEYQEDPMMQPRGLNLFNENFSSSKYLDKYPAMDEQCRKDLPPATFTNDSRQKNNTISPQKSVRFDNNTKVDIKQPNSQQYNVNEKLASSGNSQEQRSNKSKRSRGQSSEKRQQLDSEDEDEYDDEEDEESEDEDQDESDDEVMDHNLQDKIEKIKKNLKDTNSDSSNIVGGSRDDTINKLEEVLKRQRDRLENMTITNKSGGAVQSSDRQYQTQMTNNHGSELTQNFDLSKTSPMDTVKTSKRPGGAQPNLEKAYEDLEKEIFEIKSKLQQSLGASQHNDISSQRQFQSAAQSMNHTYATKNGSQGNLNDNARHQKQSMRSTQGPGAHPSQYAGRTSSNFRSPGELEEHDYSLSVSDLNNSMYNSSRGLGHGSNGFQNLQGSDGVIPPKFKY
ncbi:UNKNOWN [Stylonychia lemnae]|uniref:Uncharacterized protein n=1 Tax=Stylonychia lemnae TaxID=5949 RepID=A0A078AJ53_STYLE|nr:UNKNOWN [Stylonychia lemnae]|eukprot:CDW81926.1 UNKNOWN [Stylonychia lemnae]